MLSYQIVLGDVCSDRYNHFNLVRFIAAFAVLISHAWPISRGLGTVEPLTSVIGFSLGEVAVLIFFSLSGFLITRSFEQRYSTKTFLIARFARLFPGLAASLVFVGLVIGPLTSELGIWNYLKDPQTSKFFLRNLTLIQPQFTLPGVFGNLPYPAIEGSIWTLAHEVACYGLVLLLGVAGMFKKRLFLSAMLVIYVLSWAFLPEIEMHIHSKIFQTYVLALPFLVGMAFWIWRKRISLSLPILVLLWSAFALCKATSWAYPTLVFALTYSMFWLAYLPGKFCLNYNRSGDYSYGMYIYAFPVQGFVIWFWGPMAPSLNIVYAAPITLICAILSWHYIEKPALLIARAYKGAQTLKGLHYSANP